MTEPHDDNQPEPRSGDEGIPAAAVPDPGGEPTAAVPVPAAPATTAGPAAPGSRWRGWLGRRVPVAVAGGALLVGGLVGAGIVAIAGHDGPGGHGDHRIADDHGRRIDRDRGGSGQFGPGPVGPRRGGHGGGVPGGGVPRGGQQQKQQPATPATPAPTTLAPSPT